MTLNTRALVSLTMLREMHNRVNLIVRDMFLHAASSSVLYKTLQEIMTAQTMPHSTSELFCLENCRQRVCLAVLSAYVELINGDVHCRSLLEQILKTCAGLSILALPHGDPDMITEDDGHENGHQNGDGNDEDDGIDEDDRSPDLIRLVRSSNEPSTLTRSEREYFIDRGYDEVDESPIAVLSKPTFVFAEHVGGANN